MTTQQRFLGKYAGSAQQRLCAVWTDPPGAPLCLRAEPSCFDCSHGPQLEHPGALEAGHLFIVLGVASREQAAFTCCYASGGPVRGSKSTLINIHAPASASEALRARLLARIRCGAAAKSTSSRPPSSVSGYTLEIDYLPLNSARGR
jgi:hypothetical protein